MDDRDFALLHRCPLFRSTPEKPLRREIERVRHGFANYEADRIVRRQGDEYDELLVLLRGQVAGEFRSLDGRVMRVETLAAPEALASAFLFSPQKRLPVDVVAVTRVRLFRIEREALLSVAGACPSVLEKLLEDISHRTEFLATKLRMMQFETLSERLAHYLLHQMAAQGSASIALPVAKKELANILGAARQSVFRCLGELEEEGILRHEGRTIHVVDPARLRERATADD
ncbi:MAG: Crp/Fnr family transcriptional regulator [Spirochaetaceae bacterium]